MPAPSPFLKKLANKYIWRRIFYQRLTEPIHLNALALVVAAIGSFRLKVAFDVVLRAHTANSMLSCADLARSLGIRRVGVIEFGVAAGAGLLNTCAIGKRVTEAPGVASTASTRARACPTAKLQGPSRAVSSRGLFNGCGGSPQAAAGETLD